MNNRVIIKSSSVVLLFAIMFGCTLCNTKNTSNSIPPDLLYADGEVMFSLKKDFQDSDPDVVPLINRLIQCADNHLEKGPFSIMKKDILPPSGDKHDYISQGPYWWPDTTKADGLPYIRRDGVVNPERSKFTDRQNLHDLIESTEYLSKAFYFTNNEKYAVKTVELLDTWFLQESTKMNPNLEFGQGIPGITEGRGIGIIETRTIGKIADALALIHESKSYSTSLEDGIKLWASDYLNWLLNSDKGKKEAIHPNNHGTWYDVQAISLALFTNQDSIARAIAERAKSLRLDAHIMGDGSQPEELARTRSFSYSAMNLQGLFHLAYIANKVGVDLWNYKNKQGASLEDALKLLIPAALGNDSWEYEQIYPIQDGALKFHAFLATKVYSSNYLEVANQMIENEDVMPCQGIHIYFY